MNGFTVGCVICGVVLVLILPYYCKITFPGKNKKTLTFKMIQSSLFVLTAVFAILATGNTQSFIFVMLAGFLLSAIGDYFLGKGESSKMFLTGALFFTLAHISYITAYSMACKAFFPDTGWFNLIDVSVYISMLSAVVLLCILRKPRFHKLLVPMLVYFCILILMFTKAFGFGLRLSFDNGISALLLPLGAFLFVCSDATLSMMRYKMAKRSFAMRSFSSCTYFLAQIFMALSILFIE